MPDTFTPGGLLLIGNGERSGTWGTVTNTNMQILGRMISQAGTIALSGTTHTLTVSDGVLSDGHYAVLVFGGTPSGTNTVTISPNDARRTFFVKNDSGQSVVLTQGSGGDVTVADGKTAIVYCDGAGSGAEVVDITANLAVTAPTLADLGVTASDAELNILDGATLDTADLNLLDGVTWTLTDYNTLTAAAAELNLLDGVTWTLVDYNTLTATASELNLLDGVTWTLVDYNTLTATAAELNQLDGVTLGNAVTLDEVTAAQWRANTADKLLSTDQVWGAMAEVTLTDGANIALDLSAGFDFVVTLGGNRTLDNPTNAKVGQRGRIRVVQDGTGSRTLAYGTNYEFANGTGPTLTTTASAEDILYYDVISASRILVTAVRNIS